MLQIEILFERLRAEPERKSKRVNDIAPPSYRGPHRGNPSVGQPRHSGHFSPFPDIFSPFPDIVRECPETGSSCPRWDLANGSSLVKPQLPSRAPRFAPRRRTPTLLTREEVTKGQPFGPSKPPRPRCGITATEVRHYCDKGAT